MRKDMKFIIGDGVRGGSKELRVSRNYKFGEDDALIERKKDRINTWDLAERKSIRYQPIYRFLNKRIGKNWNDVYGEICELTKGKLGYKLKQMFDRIVDVKHKFQWSVYSIYFVDKMNLLQKRTFKRHRSKKIVDSNVIRINNESEYRRIDGIWYKVKLKIVDLHSTFIGYDIVTKMPAFVRYNQLHNACHKNCIAVEKKQLNSSDIQKIKRGQK